MASASNPLKVAPPHGLRVVSISSSSFTVAAKASSGANRYRLFASTTRSDLFVSNIKAAHRSSLSSAPVVSVHGLKYAASPYYFRVEAINGKRHRYSSLIGAVGLRPATPAQLGVRTTGSAQSLTWQAVAATGYEIQQSTSSTMSDPRVYTTDGPDTLFTPYGLSVGTTYYYTVSALNGTTPSAPSAPVPMTAATSQQSLRVMSYNILEDWNDGRKEGDGTVAPWSKRVNGVVKLVHQADPDVIAIQEGANWAGNPNDKVRQVDSLVNHLNGEYSLADTEIPPTQHHYFRTGVYILYKTSEYRAVGQGDHWGLGNQRWAAHQVLENLATGARFLMVAPHLIVGDGRKFDDERKAETKSLLSQADAYDSDLGLPIVYAGDFNSDSDKRHTFNAPAEVMQAANIDDAFDVAQSRVNAQYNSANEYFRRPPKAGYHIDYVFVTPGVAVTSWKLELDLTHGKLSGVIPSDHNPLVVNLRFPY